MRKTSALTTAGALAVALHGWVPGAAEPRAITTGSLIREMVDLRRLAEFPEPFYRTVQFSSYDRRSRFPSGAGWFANDDGFGGEPIPNFEEVLREPNEDGIGEYLICDVEGPGAVVRLWTARIQGSLRVFLDGSQEALYEGPAEVFFQRTYEALGSARDTSPFDETYSQAEAGYYPIPFAKRASRPSASRICPGTRVTSPRWRGSSPDRAIRGRTSRPGHRWRSRPWSRREGRVSF